jgi:DivIVA domain-containing protein
MPVRRDSRRSDRQLPPPFGHTHGVAAHRSSQRGAKKAEPSPEPLEQGPISSDLRAHVPTEIRNVSFPVSVRGYDRRTVDAYIQRVNRVIAELEVSRSPRAAVRHAVDRVTEQTKAILQQARESAEQITADAHEEAEGIMAGAKAEAVEVVVNASADADREKAEADEFVASARAEAEDIVARAKADAEKTLERAREEATERLRRSREEIAAMQEQAEARLRELRADTEAVWNERSELLAEIHGMATRLQEEAGAAAARFSREEPSVPAEEAPRAPQAEPDAESGVSATGESTEHGRGAAVRRRPGGRTSRAPG